VSLRSIGVGNGLTLDVPIGWDLKGAGFVNRATTRLLLAGNIDIGSLASVPNNGDVDVAALPSGSVTVEVESFCSLFCNGPADETPLPLNWSAAVAFNGTQPSGRHALALGFRWFDRPLFLVARWVDDAPDADVAAIADIVRSVRADPPLPATGEYNRWDGLGPLASIPPGTVRLVPLPAGATIRPPYQNWDNGRSSSCTSRPASLRSPRSLWSIGDAWSRSTRRPITSRAPSTAACTRGRGAARTSGRSRQATCGRCP